MNDLVSTGLFDDHFDELEKRQARRASRNLIMNTGRTEDVAEAVKIGAELGVPPQAVLGAPDFHRNRAAQIRTSTALQSSPMIQEWLGDPVNGALAKDDVHSLTWFERNFGAGGRAAGRGVRRVGVGLRFQNAVSMSRNAQDVGKSVDDLTAEFLGMPEEYATDWMIALAREKAQVRFDQIQTDGEGETEDQLRDLYIGAGAEYMAGADALRQFSQSIPMSDSAMQFRDGTLANAPNTVSGAFGAFIDDPVRGAAFIAETGAETLPVLAGAAATTAATRSPGAGITVMAGASYLSESAEMSLKFLDEKGVDLSSPDAAALILQDRELMAEAHALGVERGVIIAAFDAVSGGIAGKALMESPAGDMFLQGVAQASLGAGGEAAAQMSTEGRLNWKDIVIEGLAEFATAPVEVVGVARNSLRNRLASLGRSGESAAIIDEIDEVAAGSQVKARSPEKFQEAISAAGAGNRDMFVSADGLREYFQAKDTALDDETLRAWGIEPEDFAEKVSSGGDVAISASTYAARISGTDDAAWFRDNATFSLDEMSVADAARFNNEVTEIMAEAFEEAQALAESEQALKAADVQIYDQMFSDLRAAGRSPDVAANEAQVWSGFWRSMGERYGEDSLDLARLMGVRVQGPQTPEVARRRDQMDVMLNTLRAKGDKALAPAGRGVLDFVRELGGVRDRGGDVEALDVPAGVIGESRASVLDRESQPLLGGAVDLNARGRGLDEIGRAMIEAGYFPELLGGADVDADGTVVDEAALALQAITDAVSGRDRFPDGQGPDQDLVDLAAQLESAGVDLALSNDEIVAALQGVGERRQFNQSDPVGSDAFRDWAGTDEVLDPDEVNYEPFSGPGPWVMRAYHGTTHEFSEFDASVKGSKEGHFGAVNYFSTSEADASGNYGENGPDLTSRIAIKGERIEAEIEYLWSDILEQADGPEDAFADLLVRLSEDYDFDTGSIDDLFIDGDPDEGVDAVALAGLIAESDLKGGEEKVLEVYVRSEKPFVVGGDASPFAEFVDFSDLESRAIDRVAEGEGIEVSEVEERRDEFEDQIDDARWEIESETENPLFDAIQAVADRYDFDGSEVLAQVSELALEGANHSELETQLRTILNRQSVEDPETGDLISHHVLAEIIEELGFDAIIMKNADQQFEGMDIAPGTAHIHVFDSHNTNIKSVENEGEFDRGNADIYHQGARGSIVLPRGGLTEGQTIINLFESANLSTFLHESGHFFLEAFTALATSPDAPQAMQDDLAVIHKFLKVEDGKALGVDQHETWARAFEAYLMEGKAPSLELMSAFSRFKAWLTRIYKTARGLNVKLTPEIRGVMDRMLATDKEIADMRDDLGMRPLFSDAPDGMSDTEFATYQRIARRGVEQAESALMNKTMATVRRETEKWFKTEKAAVRAEVEASANRMPVFRLIEMLGNQKWLGDTEQEIPDIQIDRNLLTEQFGDGVLAELSRSRVGGKRAIYGANGESPQVVAEMFGFGSALEMVEALQNSGKRKDYIAAEVARIMDERHGDPLTDGAIEEAAALAAHSEQQIATSVTEARTLAKRMGRPVTAIRGKVYRQRAKAMIGAMSVREASRPASFLNAERKAAATAQKEFAKVAKGGRNSEAALAAAMQAKEQQILNQYLYREARDFEARLQAGREKMRNYSKESVRKKVGLSYVDEETGELVPGHIEQIDALLDQYDFRVRSKRQIENSESLRDYVDRMNAEGRGEELAIDERFISQSQKKHYTRLTVDELQGLFDTIQNIDHMGRRRAALVDRARRRDLNEVASVVSGLVRKRFGSDKVDNQSGHVKNFFNLLWRVDTIAADIDGDEMGDFYDAIKRPLDEGAALEQKMNAKSAADIEDIFSVYSSKEKSDFNTARAVPGANGHPWTKQQILSVALNTGNGENKKRILDRRVHESVRLTEPQLEALLDTLDKRDWDFVQSVWDYVDGFKKEAFDTAERMKGIRPKTVEAEAFTNKHGSYRGGYYPIQFDTFRSSRASRRAESAVEKFMSANKGSGAKVSDGFTQNRGRDAGGRSLNYDFSVIMKHTRDSTRLIAMGEPVQNAQKILNHRDVLQSFYDGGAVNLHETFKLFLDDVASGPVYSEDPINGAARIIKNNFTLSRLAFNLKTVALQVTGLGQSAAVIGKMNLLKGFNEYRKRPNQITKEIMAKSPFMAERQDTFQKDVYDQANELRLMSPIASKSRRAKEWITKAGFTPMIKTQFYVVDVPTWIGAYQAELQKNGGDEARAVHFADRMVDRSQGGGFMTDRNAFERGTLSGNVRQADFVRLWTTLGGYMATKMNRGYLTARSGGRKISEAETAALKVKEAASLATDMVMLYVFEAAMMGIAYSLLADDEDDEDVRNFMMTEIAGAAMGGIPFVRESVSAFKGYGAGGVLSSALEIPSNIWTQVSQGDNDRAFRRSVLDAVGLMTGLPSTQFMRVIEELIEGDEGSIVEAAIGRNPLDS